MGNSGIELKIPLTATGSTAPEANLETAPGSLRAVGPRASDDVTSGGNALDDARPWATQTKLELSSTAEAAPPT
jgi:hypothetical protein